MAGGTIVAGLHANMQNHNSVWMPKQRGSAARSSASRSTCPAQRTPESAAADARSCLGRTSRPAERIRWRAQGRCAQEQSALPRRTGRAHTGTRRRYGIPQKCARGDRIRRDGSSCRRKLPWPRPAARTKAGYRTPSTLDRRNRPPPARLQTARNIQPRQEQRHVKCVQAKVKQMPRLLAGEAAAAQPLLDVPRTTRAMPLPRAASCHAMRAGFRPG